ncbi:YnfC family lipoprotein [Escherichia coli]
MIHSNYWIWKNNTVVALVLDANYYRDAETLEKRVRLQGKCQLAELPSAGVSWETDDNGFVIKSQQQTNADGISL